MYQLNTQGLGHREINERLRQAPGPYTLTGCLGQRLIAAGMGEGSVTIEGIPGNALGAYLDGGLITVKGNAQDAVGDTMNAGEICIHGSAGDAAGYAMRGGRIFIRGNAGYRAGIHMKAYREKSPVMIIGGKAGSFLGEYQAGGIIAVLGLESGSRPIVGNFPCTGMHGGKLFLRGDWAGLPFPSQVTARAASPEDMGELQKPLEEFCKMFSLPFPALLDSPFTIVTPDTKNPYHQMYVRN